MENQTIGFALFQGKPDVLGVVAKGAPAGKSPPGGETFLDVLQEMMPVRPPLLDIHLLTVVKIEVPAPAPLLVFDTRPTTSEAVPPALPIKEVDEAKAMKQEENEGEANVPVSSLSRSVEPTTPVPLSPVAPQPVQPVPEVAVTQEKASDGEAKDAVKGTPVKLQDASVLVSPTLNVLAEERASLPEFNPDPESNKGKVEQTTKDQSAPASDDREIVRQRANPVKGEIPKALLDLLDMEVPVPPVKDLPGISSTQPRVASIVTPAPEPTVNDSTSNPVPVIPEKDLTAAIKAEVLSVPQPPKVRSGLRPANVDDRSRQVMKTEGRDETANLTEAPRAPKMEKVTIPEQLRVTAGDGSAKGEPVPAGETQGSAQPLITKTLASSVATLVAGAEQAQSTPSPSRKEEQDKTTAAKEDRVQNETPGLSQGMHAKPVQPDPEMNEQFSGRNNSSVSHHQQPVVKSEGVVMKEHFGGVATHTAELPAALSRSVVDQVIKEMAIQIRGNSSEMRITLQPESLGEVSLKIRMEDGKMQAQIDVTQPAVKAAIETNMPQLRQALSARGIEVQRIDVFVPEQSLSKESGEGGSDRPKRRGGKAHPGLDAVEQYQSVKMMGYNTMDIVM